MARRARRLRSDVARTPRVVLPALVVFILLWTATLLASDAPRLVVTAFWIVVGGAITGWVWSDARRDAGYLRGMIRGIETALTRDEASVYDIEATAYAELEEFEDEGATFVFDLGAGRLVFLSGQEFYPSARFPSLSFSLVEPLDEHGAPASFWIEKRGERVEPSRVVSAEVKWTLKLPENLSVIEGSLDDIETILA